MDNRDRVAVDTRDRSVADAHSKSTMANVVGWLALILSIAALVLAWTAYNNASEENLGDMIQDRLQGTTQVEQQQQDGVFNDDVVAPDVNDGTMNNGDTMNNDDATMPEDGTTASPENN